PAGERGDEDEEPERQKGDEPYHPGAQAGIRLPGTGAARSISARISLAPTPRTRADGFTISRCASADSASAFTSSGIAESRPRSSARAWGARNSASEPRGLAPR